MRKTLALFLSVLLAVMPLIALAQPENTVTNADSEAQASVFFAVSYTDGLEGAL